MVGEGISQGDTCSRVVYLDSHSKGTAWLFLVRVQVGSHRDFPSVGCVAGAYEQVPCVS